MKLCSTCKTEKSLTDFRKNRTSSDGLQSNCASCDSARARDYYKQNSKKLYKQIKEAAKRRSSFRREVINALKRANGCAVCTENEPCALDFHHVDSTEKESAIASMLIRGRSKEALLAELAKCELLCSNCHRKHHSGIVLVRHRVGIDLSILLNSNFINK